jgi:choline-sulfatase
VLCDIDSPQLFDLATDPHELTNVADDPAYAEVLKTLSSQTRERWDFVAFDRDVRTSQARRHVVYAALRNGAYYPWDYQPLQKASERYMRNHMDLNVLEESQRFPRGE